MKLALKLTCLLAALSVTAQTAMAAGLFSLTGEWRGVGAIVTEPGAPGREGRCRLTATPLVAGREMRLKGRCATDRGSADLSMRFVLHEGGVLAAAVASSARGGEAVQFIGRLEGGVARLSSRAPIEQGGIRGTSRFSLTLRDGDHFRLRQWLEPVDGGAPLDMVEMEFARAQ